MLALVYTPVVLVLFVQDARPRDPSRSGRPQFLQGGEAQASSCCREPRDQYSFLSFLVVPSCSPSAAIVGQSTRTQSYSCRACRAHDTLSTYGFCDEAVAPVASHHSSPRCSAAASHRLFQARGRRFAGARACRLQTGSSLAPGECFMSAHLLCCGQRCGNVVWCQPLPGGRR